MSSFFENLLKPFSTREKTVTNEKKKQKIDNLYEEISSSILELADKVNKINKYKQDVSESTDTEETETEPVKVYQDPKLTRNIGELDVGNDDDDERNPHPVLHRYRRHDGRPQNQVFKAGYSKRNACIGIWNFILHVTCSQSFNTLYLQMIEKQVLGYW